MFCIWSGITTFSSFCFVTTCAGLPTWFMVLCGWFARKPLACYHRWLSSTRVLLLPMTSWTWCCHVDVHGLHTSYMYILYTRICTLDIALNVFCLVSIFSCGKYPVYRPVITSYITMNLLFFYSVRLRENVPKGISCNELTIRTWHSKDVL